MNTTTKLATAVAALGLTWAWTTQADDPKSATSAHVGGEKPQAEAVVEGREHAVEPAATSLSFAYRVHGKMTKEVFKIKQDGRLKIENQSPDHNLRIEAQEIEEKKGPPFEVPGISTPQLGFTVPPKSKIEVKIAGAYTEGDEFTFQSRIGESQVNDPIVIIERP